MNPRQTRKSLVREVWQPGSWASLPDLAYTSLNRQWSCSLLPFLLQSSVWFNRMFKLFAIFKSRPKGHHLVNNSGQWRWQGFVSVYLPQPKIYISEKTDKILLQFNYIRIRTNTQIPDISTACFLTACFAALK